MATTSTQLFLDKAFYSKGPKLLSGFSRPVFHNLMGMLYGHQFSKSEYGGMIRHTEAAMLYRWARCLKPGSTIVEIGCYGGLSTCYLAKGLRQNQDSRLFSIDPFNSDLEKQNQLSDGCVELQDKPTKELVYKRLASHGLTNNVTLIQGYSQDVAKNWDQNITIDFLWIDGNHEQAYQDFVDFKPFLNPGALVAVHDAHPRYGYQTVVDDVRKIFADDHDWQNLEHVKSIIAGTWIGI